MDTLQKEIIKRRSLAMTAVRNAKLLDCASFYAKYEPNIELEEVSNIMDYNEGMVVLIYHGSDHPVQLEFYNGDLSDWSYCS